MENRFNIKVYHNIPTLKCIENLKIREALPSFDIVIKFYDLEKIDDKKKYLFYFHVKSDYVLLNNDDNNLLYPHDTILYDFDTYESEREDIELKDDSYDKLLKELYLSMDNDNDNENNEEKNEDFEDKDAKDAEDEDDKNKLYLPNFYEYYGNLNDNNNLDLKKILSDNFFLKSVICSLFLSIVNNNNEYINIIRCIAQSSKVGIVQIENEELIEN